MKKRRFSNCMNPYCKKGILFFQVADGWMMLDDQGWERSLKDGSKT